MKKVFCFTMLMVFILSPAIAQKTVRHKDKKVKAPEITFERVVYDYGSITQGDNGICEFAFKNTGKSDLILTNCRSTCGCTVPQWPKGPVAPGKKGVIRVRYNTQRLGGINKSVTVESNATNGRVVLSLKGNVSPKPVEAAPENNLGNSVKAR